MSVTEHGAPQYYQLKDIYTCACFLFDMLPLFKKKKGFCMIGKEQNVFCV